MLIDYFVLSQKLENMSEMITDENRFSYVRYIQAKHNLFKAIYSKSGHTVVQQCNIDNIVSSFVSEYIYIYIYGRNTRKSNSNLKINGKKMSCYKRN